MVDEIVTRQELIDAKRDAQDLGKAVNEKVIVSPRYGGDFKSLPMIADEFQDAIETAAAAGAGANGWTDLLIQTADGSTQRAKNASFQSQIDQKASAAYLDAELAAQTQTVNTALSQLSTQASKFYPTLAEASADIANITVNQPVQVGETGENGGLWYKATAGATSLTKSPYDPLTQAKADATTKANAAEANSKNYTKTLTSESVDFSKNTLLLAQADFVSGYLRSDGVVQALGGFSYTSNYIPLSVFYQYVVEGSAGTSLGGAGTCFYDINQNFISGVSTSTLVNGSKLTPPDGAIYVRFCIKTDSTALFNVRVSSKTIIDIESSLRDPVIYQSASSNQNLENRNPNNVTTANLSGGVAIIQFAKQDFPFFLDSCEILMPANSKADIYLYKINSITSITKLKKVGSVSNNSSAIANVSFNFGRYLFVPKGYFLAYQATSGGFLFTTNSEQGTSFASLYKATAIPDLNGDAAVLSGDWSSNFYLPLKYTYTSIQYSTMDNLVADLADIRSDIDDVEAGVVSVQKKHEYISVYHDNFKQSTLQTSWEDIGSSWQFDFDKGEVKPTAIGGSSYSGGTIRTNTLRLKSTYNANKRSAMMRVSFAANTVLEFATTSQFPTGMRIFRVDFANALLQEYSTNGTTLLRSTPITIPLVVGKQYIVRLDVDRLQERFQIMDYITGQSSTLIKNSTNSGDIQLAHYTLALRSGSPFTMYEFDVSVKNKPKVYIVGDSITAQVASGVEGWAYRFTDLLQGDVIISAQGSTNGFNVPLLIESEAKHIKPDILLWCHGHNGGVTQENLDNVKALCDQYGIKMYVNHVTCSAANNHLAINELIEKNGYKGARFDIATARDNNPYPVEGDSAIRADSNLYTDVAIHPNIAGNQKMFERLAIDLPELLY